MFGKILSIFLICSLLIEIQSTEVDNEEIVDLNLEQINSNNSNNESNSNQLNIENNENLTSQELNSTIENSKMDSNKFTKTNPVCLKSNLNRTENYVILVNGSVLTKYLNEAKENECFMVLFFVPWCPFSARLAPIYNALPRAFLEFDILAFDVSKSIGYNTKYGTSAVPIIILFQQKNILAKFNYTQKNLSDYVQFVSNITGFSPNKDILIEVPDFEGPVPTVAVERFDYFLLISWIFLIFVCIDFLLRKTQFKNLLIEFFKNLLNYNRILQLPQPVVRPMIQHLHND